MELMSPTTYLSTYHSPSSCCCICTLYSVHREPIPDQAKTTQIQLHFTGTSRVTPILFTFIIYVYH
jgi:hypothetical protein